ncbi:porin [Alphaproteobacteria bacterium]|nr:porin [Alphaproteobacteria bacterium]
MRKLLLGTTALAAAATLSANAVLADVAISGSYEFKYKSTSSEAAANDGTSFSHGDNDLILTFTNKTDSGLTLSYRYDFTAVSSDAMAHSADENSLSISGGFGKIVLGTDDDASDSYNQDEMDLITEEPSISLAASASIRQNSSVASSDAMKIAYHIPAMGGLTAGVSHTDSGANGSTDTTAYGAKYSMDAGGANITLSYAAKKQDATTTDKDDSSIGAKISSGPITFLVSQGQYEAEDEDIETQGASITYALGNGITLGAFTVKSEDDLDAGEEFSASGAEIQYTIASGLSAVISHTDYDYKFTQSTHEGSSGNLANDNGSATQLTIKASF